MGINDELAIGAVRPDETDAMLRLMCEAFGMDFDEARPIYYDDPYFDVENKVVLRIGHEIISCLTVVHRECWVGEAHARVAGIAGVATRVGFRQRGFAGRLLTEALRLLDVRGVHFCALFPADRAYYRNFGWETGARQYTSRTDIAGSARRGGPVQVRSAAGADLPSLARIYDKATRTRAISCLRDRARWRCLLATVRNSVVACAADGAPEGYVLYDFNPTAADTASARPRGAGRPALRVVEMYAETPEARHALRRHLDENNEADILEYTAPLDVLAQNGFPAPAEPADGFMARIVDWWGLVRALASNWEDIDGEIGLVLLDPLLSAGPRAAIVNIAGGVTRIECADAAEVGTRFHDFVVGDIRNWSAVAIGHHGARHALDAGLLKASTLYAAEIADRLFPTRDPFLSAADHF